MPTDEYTSTPGGALKLKGSKISKASHKKKRPKPPPSPPPVQPAEEEKQQQQEDDKPLSKRRLLAVANNNDKTKQNNNRLGVEREEGEDEGKDNAVIELEDRSSGAAAATEEGQKGVWAVGKTEAERRHEEQRRKRLDERLKREGIKTHKERVEELNRYLSNLSEHHDMPRIGPG